MRQRGGTVQILRQAFGDGVFSTAQALSIGVTGRRLRLAVGTDGLRALAQGRYVIGHQADSLARYRTAADALLVARPTAVAAGVTAAAFWGLPCPDPWGDWMNLPLCLASHREIHGRPGLIRYQLGARACEWAGDRLLTDLATTACDVARQLPPPQALIVVDAAARRLAGVTDRYELRSVRLRNRVRRSLAVPIALHPRPGGAEAARTINWADPAAESPPESYLRGHMLQAGRLVPSVGHPFPGASGKVYWIDMYWPDLGLAIEIDGKVKYSEPDALYREKLRADDLRAAGMDPWRWEAERVFRSAARLVKGLSLPADPGFGS